jgi:hypothetical protein
LKKEENFIFSNFKNPKIKFFWKTGKNKNIPTITNKHHLTKNKEKTKQNMKKQKITFFQRNTKRGRQQSKKKNINTRKEKKLLINMNRLEKLIQNLRNTFKVAVTPYKAMLMKAGIEMVVYDEVDDETQTAIVGIKIIVNNPEVWQKLKEEE